MKKVVIIGAGKVGVSLAFHLQRRGYPIAAVASRTENSLERAKKYLKAGLFTLELKEAVERGEIIFISTNDDAVSRVAEKIGEEGGFKSGQFVYHLSGALSIEVLKPASDAGASVGSLHPMQTFPSIEAGIKKIPGTVFGVTGKEEVLRVAEELIKAVGGKMVEVKDEDKPLYHAAACIACNYLDALMYTAFKFYGKVGMEEGKAWQAMKPLIHGTLDNIEAKGAVEALTGPIARGDVDTVKKHLQAIEKSLPDFLSFYKEVGKITLEVAKERGLSEKAYQEIFNLLF